MGVLAKLSRLVGSADAVARADAVEALQRCFVACARRAAALREYAEQAPQECGAAGLRELADGEDALAARLRAALQAAGAPSLPAVTPAPQATANHWSRLVRALEDHRDAVAELRELAMRFGESLPATASLFADLCERQSVHCERLRALIARADPQALD